MIKSKACDVKDFDVGPCMLWHLVTSSHRELKAFIKNNNVMLHHDLEDMIMGWLGKNKGES